MATHNKEYRLYIISSGKSLNKQVAGTTAITTTITKCWEEGKLSHCSIKNNQFSTKIMRHTKKQETVAHTQDKKLSIETVSKEAYN